MNEKEWTIMVYMAGDNNLAVDMAYAMEQIKEVAGKSSDKLNLLVYYDGCSPDIPTLYCDFSDPKDPKYVSSESVDAYKPYPVSKKRNENAADTKSILNFVDWCVNVNEEKTKRGRRAEKYALIFSGHSLGFADKGLFKDETSGKSMKIMDLSLALQRLVLTKKELEMREWNPKIEVELMLTNTDLLLGQPLDILGFDSCLMGMLEVGYQFAGLTKTMIVSEGSIPSAGWSYAKILTDLTNKRYKNTQDMAGHFVKSFIESQDKYIIGGISVDMAAWDMNQFFELADQVNFLGEDLIKCFELNNGKKSRVYKQMERIILQVHWKCQSYMFDQNVDLGDFCELLIQECESVVQEELSGGDDTEVLSNVIVRCRQVLTALESAVILSGFSGGEYQYSNGVSLFFPWSLEAYEVSKKNYQGTWFSLELRNAVSWTSDRLTGDKLTGDKLIGWDDFLKKYLKEVSRRAQAPITAKRSSERSQELILDSSDSKKYVYVSGVNFYERLDSSSLEDTESLMTDPGHSESSVRQGGSGSSVRQGGSGSSVRQGGSGSSVRQGGSGSSVRQGGSGSSVRQGGSGSSVRQGGSASGGADGFFNALKLRKNTVVRWDISGFTKNPEEEKKAEKGEPES